MHGENGRFFYICDVVFSFLYVFGTLPDVSLPSLVFNFLASHAIVLSSLTWVHLASRSLFWRVLRLTQCHLSRKTRRVKSGRRTRQPQKVAQHQVDGGLLFVAQHCRISGDAKI